MNTRYTSAARAPEFGASGNWRHSYQWTIEPVVFTKSDSTKWTVMPAAYIVNYPDGRQVSFSAANGDTYFRGGPCIADRFQQLSGTNGGDWIVGTSGVYVAIVTAGHARRIIDRRSEPSLRA